MIKALQTASVAALLLLTTLAAPAQTNVANYAFGKHGTAQYEHISFWVKDGKRAEITYALGANRKEFKLVYAGPDKVNGQPAFRVRFTNQHTLYIIPSGTVLKVTESKAGVPKLFAWEYEGPVNGIGTFCNVCAEDEKSAIQLILKSYMK